MTDRIPPRLIEASEIDASRLAGSSFWQIPVDAILAFEQRRDDARRSADEHALRLTPRALRLSSDGGMHPEPFSISRSFFLARGSAGHPSVDLPRGIPWNSRCCSRGSADI